MWIFEENEVSHNKVCFNIISMTYWKVDDFKWVYCKDNFKKPIYVKVFSNHSSKFSHCAYCMLQEVKYAKLLLSLGAPP